MQRWPELDAIVRRYLQAYGENDTDTMLNLYADDPAVRYVGTDAGEFWDGATFRTVLPGFARTKPAYRIVDLDVEGFEFGAFGYAVFALIVEFATGKTSHVRGTHVFRLERGVWRLLHAHHSSPASNIENMGFEAEDVEDLLAAAESQPTDLGQSGIASVMFTDLADSTTLAQAMGDAAWNRLVRAHLEAVRKCIAAAGGKLVKTLGDGTMSSFPTAGAALRAAQAIQRNNQARQSEPHLGLRIGIHTGDVVETGGDFLGTVVNKAARVAAITSPGDICVSDATRAMVGNATEFQITGPASVALKGLDGDHMIYRLEWHE